MKKINVAIIGCGRMGERHACAYKISNKVNIRGFFDTKKPLAKKLSSTFKGNVYSTLDSLIEDDSIDAVNICTPNSFHFEPLQLAIENEKYVLVEKPIVTTEKECSLIEKLMEKSCSKIMVGHTHRFFPCNLALKSLLDSGKIGKPKLINTFDFIPGRIKGQKMPQWIKSKEMSGGGVFMTDLVHTIDRISWFMESPITKALSPFLSDFITKRGLEDVGVAVLWLKNGSLATCVQGCPSAGAWDMSTKIIGAKGEINMEFAGKLELVKEKISSINYSHKGNYLKHSNAGFASEISEFIECVKRDRKPIIDYKHGIKAIRVVLALYESFRKKKPIFIKN